MCPCIPDRIGIWQLVFLERGKPEYPEKNLSEQGENQQQTQPTYDAGTGNRTRPHWWEASALTTAPPLLPPAPLRFNTIARGWQTVLRVLFNKIERMLKQMLKSFAWALYSDNQPRDNTKMSTEKQSILYRESTIIVNSYFSLNLLLSLI